MPPLYVQAAPGLKMPREGAPRAYITPDAPIAVEASHYYRKAIADGDLVELTDAQWAAHLAARARTEAGAGKAAAKDAPAAPGAAA